MANVIRLGDPTSHGGKVVSAAADWFTVDGIPVARVNDKCACPIPGHANCMIVEGDPNHVVDGLAVAYAGHRTSCGATLISTCDDFSNG